MSLGASGDDVSELQLHLQRLGYVIDPEEASNYGPSTVSAVEGFQRLRGLNIDGIVGDYTWAVLREASYRWADRTLQHLRPMLRGDDVAELQQRLSALGFDPGRVDGIFGGLTAGALAEFQRNVGLPANAIASSATFAEIDRVGGRHTAGSLVTTVRERSQMEDRQGSLSALSLGLSASPELTGLAEVIRAEGQGRGLVVHAIAGSDDQELAQGANLQAVAFLLVLRAAEGQNCRAIHYEGYSYRSSSGADLGLRFAALAKEAGFAQGVECSGMSLPLLRETVMPAVILEFTDEALASMDISVLATGLVEAMCGPRGDGRNS